MYRYKVIKGLPFYGVWKNAGEIVESKQLINLPKHLEEVQVDNKEIATHSTNARNDGVDCHADKSARNDGTVHTPSVDKSTATPLEKGNLADNSPLLEGCISKGNAGCERNDEGSNPVIASESVAIQTNVDEKKPAKPAKRTVKKTIEVEVEEEDL